LASLWLLAGFLALITLLTSWGASTSLLPWLLSILAASAATRLEHALMSNAVVLLVHWLITRVLEVNEATVINFDEGLVLVFTDLNAKDLVLGIEAALDIDDATIEAGEVGEAPDLNLCPDSALFDFEGLEAPFSALVALSEFARLDSDNPQVFDALHGFTLAKLKGLVKWHVSCICQSGSCAHSVNVLLGVGFGACAKT
jgi:hypothetical protein